MYNQSYEDYMQSVLGYSAGPEIYYTYDNYEGYKNNREIAAEEYFPKIYQKINPIICEVCSQNTKPFSREVANEIAERVYQRIQNENILPLEEIEVGKARSTSSSKENSNVENRQGRNNNILRDLILILTLQQLLGRPGRPPRLPHQGPGIPPTRPPFLGGSRPPQYRNYYPYWQF